MAVPCEGKSLDAVYDFADLNLPERLVLASKAHGDTSTSSSGWR